MNKGRGRQTYRVLRDERQRRTKVLHSDLADIDSVDEDASGYRIGEAKEGLREIESSASVSLTGRGRGQTHKSKS